MSDKSKPKGKPEKADKDITLDDVLLALQKSFSRVSHGSRDVPPESARALIVGNVNFELSIHLKPEIDRLIHQNDGGIQLKLNGVIQQDIRTVLDEK